MSESARTNVQNNVSSWFYCQSEKEFKKLFLHRTHITITNTSTSSGRGNVTKKTNLPPNVDDRDFLAAIANYAIILVHDCHHAWDWMLIAIETSPFPVRNRWKLHRCRHSHR